MRGGRATADEEDDKMETRAGEEEETPDTSETEGGGDEEELDDEARVAEEAGRTGDRGGEESRGPPSLFCRRSNRSTGASVVGGVGERGMPFSPTEISGRVKSIR